MRLRSLLLPLVLAACANPNAGYSDQAEMDVSSQAVAIDEVLKEVHEALALAASEIHDEGFPELSTVKLVLNTVTSWKGKGGVNLYVVAIGGDYGKAVGNKLELELTPPGPKGEDVAAEDLKETLAGMIVAASRGTAASPFELSKAVAELKFAVTKRGKGGLEFKLQPLTVELGGELSQESIQTLTVTFKEGG